MVGGVVAEVAPVGEHGDGEVAVGDERRPAAAPSISTTEPTLRSRIISAISRTDRSGGAVTTDSVMTSRMSTAARVYNRSPVAALTPAQRARVRRIEGADPRRRRPRSTSLLFAGDRVSRVAGRNQIDPEPPRRADGRRGARDADRRPARADTA